MAQFCKASGKIEQLVAQVGLLGGSGDELWLIVDVSSAWSGKRSNDIAHLMPV